MKRICSVRTVISIIAVCIMFFYAAPGHGQRGPGGPERMGGPHGDAGYEMVSKRVVEEIAMDSVDSVWDSINGFSVELMARGAPNLRGVRSTVELKSVYTDANIYIYASWPDRTESVFKDIWIKQADGTWQQADDDEDRLGLLWEIDNSMPEFSRGRGAMEICHQDPDNAGQMMKSTRLTGGRADLWHWKAARTNPVGFCDDQFVDPEGRKSDPGTSAYKDNVNEDGTAPAMMPPGGPMDSPFLFAAEAVPFDDGAFKPGDRVPAYILRTPDGDRADIEAHGVHEQGYWTVVLKRSLETGNPSTDVQFAPGGAYVFGVALFDNAGDDDHIKSRPIRLSFE